MTRTFDVVIIGGGVVGSAIAYFLAGETDFPGSILVVEPDPTYDAAATGRSAGGLRQQFSTPENIRMSRFGADFVRSAGERLAVGGDAPDVSFVERGYLFLATEAGMPALRANHRTQTALRADVALLSPDELRARFPWLAVEGLTGGSLGLAGEGWIDPHALLQALRRKARSLGVTYATDKAVGLELAGNRIVAARLGELGRVGCGTVVNAAGYRSAEIAAMAGLSLPVRPRKRFVFVFDCRTAITGAPRRVDPSGVYFRPEGSGFICGVSPPADADPDCLDFEIDYALFEEVIWPALARRVPAFEAIKLTRAWAGHYDYNTLDQNAILGPHPDVANFLFASGFSGHGLQQSPAVGRALSELIAYGEYRTLDLRRFAYDRVLTGAAIRELNVV